jgi:FAD/FMN-containing dehydrogenase
VVRATLAHGLTPPTLTDLLDLRVGGTLAVGGIGGQSFLHGAQTDCVRALEVVTGAGERQWCSPRENPALFDACRAGLGQCGIVRQAELSLVPVPGEVRTYTFLYQDLPAYLADLTRLASEDRFDHLSGLIVAWGDGAWRQLLLCAKYHPPGAPPDEGQLLRGLEHQELEDRADSGYLAFADRSGVEMERMREAGMEKLPHPFEDTFLPASQAASFIEGTLDGLDPRAYRGSILLYPLRRSRCRTPLLQLPQEEELVLFDLLPFVQPEQVEETLAFNRSVYDRSVAVGGKNYPIGSVPLRAGDWPAHYGAHWERFAAAKGRFDPDRLLTPGQKLF